MTRIIQILNFEEGFRSRPYLDSRGYPTVGVGFLIGPRGAAISNYTFSLPKVVSDVWLQEIVTSLSGQMNATPAIYSALKQCNPPRADILSSMCYQMGIAGVAGFKNTLSMIAAGNFSGAAAGMLQSQWAKQTPARASRHAEVMRTGTYDIYKGLI